MLKSLVTAFLSTLVSVLALSSTAAAHERPAAPPLIDERPIVYLQAGSAFIAKQDLFIPAGRPATILDGSEIMSIRSCFLQAYNASPRDRVVRAGRELTLNSVHIGPGYFALAIDDGKDNVLAQIGCNFFGPSLPLVGDLRAALEQTFDMDLIDIPVDEVSVHL